MLDHCYVRPKTADRIGALWLGPAIDRYAGWMAERGAAKATATRNLQALILFDQFARNRGAMTWADAIRRSVDAGAREVMYRRSGASEPPIASADSRRADAAAVDSRVHRHDHSSHRPVSGTRHSFAVGTLLRWYRTGVDAAARLHHLSTFLGHVRPDTTAVYLTITSDLLAEANRRCEAAAAPSIAEVRS